MERRSGGFTLIELLIVIAIIAILASIAIPQYLKYQRKSKVSSYALPATRACAMDILAWCVENPGATNFTDERGAGRMPNCGKTGDHTINTAGGQVDLSVGANIQCASNGSISVGTNQAQLLANASLRGVDDYEAICVFYNESMKCEVRGK